MARTSDDSTSARAVALDLLGACLHKRRPLEEALAGVSGLAKLAPRDRAFARLLVASVLRRLPQLDALIGRALRQPLSGEAWVVQDILRLGAVQLLFLKTPAHAGVGETVALADAGNLQRFKGLINAVLRRLDREGAGWVQAQAEARINTPDWLWRSWSDAYGAARCEAIARTHLDAPPLDLTPRGDPVALAEKLGAQRLPTGSLRLAEAAPVAGLPGYDEGAWWVQDAGAALPVRLLDDVAGRTVVDMCAAPGGKTAQLAAAGASVIAVDRSPARMARLGENLDRLGLGATRIVADAARWRPDRPVDAVLLDAPCSATGTIRRHPDIQRLKSEADIARLTTIQDRLLAAALDMLRPGGMLVYCVCSLQAQEGEQRIAEFLATGAAAELAPIEADELAGEAAFLTARGELRTLPCHWAEWGGIDGFYAARLRRL
jgi:16S rRNA (cytosine967-C5)-methyltransferase